jgi:hypothetical protein
MVKKLLVASAALVGALAVAGAVLYAWNAAPAVPPVAVDASTSARPYVVKLHAQWCPVCLVTKDVWSQIETAYAGQVNLLVLDFTTEAKTEASRAEARRLGLDAFFDEVVGATGVIVVLDGRTREILSWLDGDRDSSEYRTAIDAALSGSAAGSASRTSYVNPGS